LKVSLDVNNEGVDTVNGSRLREKKHTCIYRMGRSIVIQVACGIEISAEAELDFPEHSLEVQTDVSACGHRAG
jgi:hypothetical protein